MIQYVMTPIKQPLQDMPLKKKRMITSLHQMSHFPVARCLGQSLSERSFEALGATESRWTATDTSQNLGRGTLEVASGERGGL